MSARVKKYVSMYLWIVFLFITAIYLDNIAFRNPMLDFLATLISCVIYICIFVFWMMSIKWRCMHRHIRNYMMAVGACLIFWIILALLQKEFAVLPLIKRQLWYCSYIPIVFVPLMAIGAASCTAQPDTRPVEKKYLFLWIPTIAFCLFIMTNELHRLVFDVNFYETHDIITNHSPMCWTMFCWAAFLELIAIATLIEKNRVTGLRWTRIIAPLLFFVLGAAYMVLFLTGIIGGDLIAMPVAISFFHLAICESCLFLGLLPTNFYYKQFFENTDIGMQLLDADDVVNIRSRKARILTDEENNSLKKLGSFYTDGFEIYRKKVQGGFLVYEKDVREIHREIEQLKVTTSELKETDDYIVEQQRLSIRKKRLEEKERIYNEISRIIAPSLDKIDHMLEEIPALAGEEQRRMMWQINLLGTHIKRRANLELRRKESPAIFGSELSQCLAEFTVSLRAAGITSSGYFDSKSAISLDSAILILDIYTAMIEHNYLNLKDISVIQSQRDHQLCILIEGSSRKKMAIPDGRMHLFSDYAEKHGTKLRLDTENPPTTMSYTIITEDGRGEE